MRENHYAISCIKMKISQVFKSQDKHNASYFPKCRGQTNVNPTAKIQNFSETTDTEKVKSIVALRREGSF